MNGNVQRPLIIEEHVMMHLFTYRGEEMSATDFTSARTGNAPAVAPLLLRDYEVAAILNVSKSTAYALMAGGTLPGVVRIGRSIRLSREALERWVREQAA